MNRLFRKNTGSPAALKSSAGPQPGLWERFLAAVRRPGKTQAEDEEYLPWRTCPDCNHTVSSQSYICPRCNRDLRS